MNPGRASYLVTFFALIAATASHQTASAGWVTSDTSPGDLGRNDTAAVKDRSVDNPRSGSAFIDQSEPTTRLAEPSKAVTLNGTALISNDTLEDSWSNSATIAPNLGSQQYNGEFMGVGRFEEHAVSTILTRQRPNDDFGFIREFGVQDKGRVGGASRSPLVTLAVVGTNSLVGDDGHALTNQNRGDGPKVASGTDQKTLRQATSANISRSRSAQIASSNGRFPSWSHLLKGPTDVRNSRDSIKNDHAAIDVAIPIDVFLGTENAKVEWSPTVGKDVLVIKNLRISTTPEPASVALMGIGGLATCLMSARRRRRKVAS